MIRTLIIIYFFSHLLFFPGSGKTEDPANIKEKIFYDTVWVLEHYKADSNYIVGIWPNSHRTLKSEELFKLREYFGFNYIALEAVVDLERFNLIKQSGFPPESIMATFVPHTSERTVRDFGKIYAYYLDEPNESGYSIEGIRELIEKFASGSEFIISGYRRTTGLSELVPESDGVMFSSYKHWWQCFPNVWCAWPYDDDQRPDWTDMKKRYGSKSYMNWIGAHRDTLEYMDLLKHAKDLSLKGVWFYHQMDYINDDENILDYCYAAWANGFMKRFERKYIYEYKCLHDDEVLCSNPKNRTLTKIRTTDEVRMAKYK